MTTRTLAVGCPRWAITAADLDPQVPAAVFHANRVVSASPEAVACGIRRGMRRREAQSIAPDIEVLPHDPASGARAFEPIVAVVGSFAPRVEIVRPGLCVLAARGPARYFGGEEALRERVASAVDDAIAGMRSHPLHIDDRTRTGIADGPFAATIAAIHGRVVEPLGSRAFLAPFGVDMLASHVGEDSHPSVDLADLFRRLGIRTLGDLAALPRERVVARFGIDGEIVHRLASCDDERLLVPRPIPPELVVTRELDPPAKRIDVAAFAGKAAADELAAKLLELGLACAKLEVSAQTEHGESRSRIWRYSSAFTPAAIAERVRWQLEGWLQDRDRPTGGISWLRLEPLDVGPATGTKVGFWSRRGEVTDRVRRSIARVQGLLGQHGAQQATLSGGRHPSEQSTLVGWGEMVEPARPGSPGARSATGPVTVEMPPWPGRLPTPSPAIVRRVATDVVDGRGERVGVTERFAMTSEPAKVRLRGRWIDVAGWAGPWPVDERWWDDDAHRRRARFQVALTDGTAHLLSLESGTWTVEATYD